MKGKIAHKWWLSIGVTIGLLALVWAVSTALAQAPGDGPDGNPAGDTASSAMVLAPEGGPNETHAFSYQGRLIINGSPANGNYDFYVYLYTAESGGTNLGTCDNVNSVDGNNNQPVVDGIFTLHLVCAGWNSDVFTGGSRWLEVWARPTGTIPWSLLGRQPISPTPYAWSLYPGAVISSTVYAGGFGEALLNIHSDHTMATWSALHVETASGNAVYGDSAGGPGLYGYTENGYGVYGRDGGSTQARGYGGYFYSANGIGVYGYSGATPTYTNNDTPGVYGRSWEGVGVLGYSTNGTGGKFMSWGGYSIIEGWEDDVGGYPTQRFRVERDGDVYADRAYHCGLNDGGDATYVDENTGCMYDNSPADFAEVLPTANDPEPGDVLAISPDGRLVRSTAPYQTTVVGVYSTAPSYVGGAANLGEEGYAPLAIVGLVPVKASAENGPILPGDLLTTSSTPGHAMRAGEDPAVGTIIGKALEPLDAGAGVIQMLVMLQ
jgi:hypothetical protein